MEDTLTKYSHGALTIVWQPKRCIHSGHCFRGLSGVFNPRADPWIKPENSTAEQIIDQVRKCPSGALTYYLNLESSYEHEEVDIPVKNAVIEATAGGPLLVYGDVCLRMADGDTVACTGVTAFCRCGASGKKPYCDGSHRRIGFTG